MRFLLQDPNLVVWICDSVIAFIFDENYNNFGNISEIECEKYYFEIEDTRIHLLKDNEIENFYDQFPDSKVIIIDRKDYNHIYIDMLSNTYIGVCKVDNKQERRFNLILDRINFSIENKENLL